jgi:MFS family permease
MNAIIPLRNKYLNDRLEEIGRATVLSGAQMVLTLGTSTASLIGGVVAETTGSVQVFFWIGVSVAILAVSCGSLFRQSGPPTTNPSRRGKTTIPTD